MRIRQTINLLLSVSRSVIIFECTFTQLLSDAFNLPRRCMPSQAPIWRKGDYPQNQNSLQKEFTSRIKCGVDQCSVATLKEILSRPWDSVLLSPPQHLKTCYQSGLLWPEMIRHCLAFHLCTFL